MAIYNFKKPTPRTPTTTTSTFEPTTPLQNPMETVQQQPMLAAGVIMTPKQQQQKPQPPTTTTTITNKQQITNKTTVKVLTGAAPKKQARTAAIGQPTKMQRAMTDIDKAKTKAVIPPMRSAFALPVQALPTIRERVNSNVFSDATTVTINEDSADETCCGTDPTIVSEKEAMATAEGQRKENNATQAAVMEAAMQNQKEEANWMTMTKAFNIKQPRGQEEAFKQKNDFKTRGRDIEQAVQCDTSGTTVMEGTHEEGMGTEEEAPADEDGEGARVIIQPDIVHNCRQRMRANTFGVEMFEDRDRDCDRDHDEPMELITVRKAMIEDPDDTDETMDRIYTKMKPKARGHQQGEGTGVHCVNCQGRFRATKMHVGGKLCANCFKIHESIKRTTQICGGTFQMKVIRPGKVHIKLVCAQGHDWTIGMQSRKAKNWCKVCKIEMREENQRMHFERLQQQRTANHEEQERILNDERRHAPIEDPHDHPPEPINNEHIIEMQEVFVHNIIEQNRAVDPEIQFRVAEIFLNANDRTIIDFIQRMADSEQQTTAAGQDRGSQTTQGTVHQLVQRFRLALHPDKNRAHPRAAEAFTRM